MRAQFHNARHVVIFTIISVVIGAAMGHVEEVADHTTNGYLRGALTGGFICVILSSIELFVMTGAWGSVVRQAPFSVQIVLRTAIYLLVILTGLKVGPLLVSDGKATVVVHARDVWFSAALGIGFNLLIGINQLLGQGVLFAFVAGRYHKPHIEERILLFADMESSTRTAERLGEIGFLTLLNRFVGDLTSAIVEERGEIHKYVGDEVIATWKPGGPKANGRCIAACFDALRRLTDASADYEAEFGTTARFRAGLHIGPVVIGELGLFKMEIALLGDTMNTAARIQAACRETGNSILVSGALMGRIASLPDGVVSRSLGQVSLRGKEADLELFALERRRDRPRSTDNPVVGALAAEMVPPTSAA